MTNLEIVVIYHNADYDGIFCREIAKRFFEKHYPNQTEYIGWNYGDPVPVVSPAAKLYMLDISVDGLMDHPNLNWVDHHKSAIDKFSKSIPGYRIDGVAACRLAWQYFGGVNKFEGDRPTLQDFKERKVEEPYAVTLAGEYDIWDKLDPNADILQFGLRSRELSESDWAQLLSPNKKPSINEIEELVDTGFLGILEPNGTMLPALLIGLLQDGKLLRKYQQQTDASIMEHRSFLFDFEGLKFLCLNTARCDSLTFALRDYPETGHEALMGFYWDGGKFNVSLYHSQHRIDLDLSTIAVKYGGGGHRGACGFNTKEFLFN